MGGICGPAVWPRAALGLRPFRLMPAPRLWRHIRLGPRFCGRRCPKHRFWMGLTCLYGGLVWFREERTRSLAVIIIIYVFLDVSGRDVFAYEWPFRQKLGHGTISHSPCFKTK